MKAIDREPTILPERDESLERQESKAKVYRGRRLSAATKPTHGSLRKNGAEMDQTFPSDRKTRLGSFRLADTEGRALKHSWNADNLCCFYI
jgi:hypothetical protein